MYWWDIRNMTEPTDQLVLNEGMSPDGKTERVVGGTRIEFNPDAGVSFKFYESYLIPTYLANEIFGWY